MSFFNRVVVFSFFTFFVILSLSLCSFTVLAEVMISEVMYNPKACLDSDCEWIELYNLGNESVNLSGYFLNDKELGEIIILPEEYIVFARTLLVEPEHETDELEESDDVFYSFEEWQGNGDGIWEKEVDGEYFAYEFSLSLTNSLDEVILSNSFGEEVFLFSYDKEMGGSSNDYSLELNVEEEIVESLDLYGSPGQENGRWNISSDYSNIIISEILADPLFEDDAIKPLGEWIEMYNNGAFAVDLAGSYFEDSVGNTMYVSSANTLEGETILHPDSHLVVFRNGQSSFSLNNAGFEELFLYSSFDELIDDFSYSDSIEGMSIALIEDEWIQTAPSMGSENVYVGPCDLSLDISFFEAERSIFSSEEFAFDVTVSRELGLETEVTVKGEILDYYGDKVTSYSPFSNVSFANSRSKSYSPNLAEGIYQAHFFIQDLICDDVDLNDNDVSLFFAINPDYQQVENYLFIERFYDQGSDESYSWGEAFRVKTHIYKGDETKTAIELYVENAQGEVVSERSKVNAFESFQYYTLTIPVQLDSNCDLHFDDGKYTLVLEGLGILDRMPIDIVGIQEETCQNFEEYSSLYETFGSEGVVFVLADGELEGELEVLSSGTTVSSNEVSLESDVESFTEPFFVDMALFDRKGVVAYSSTSQKAFSLIPYLMIACLLFASVIFWKR